LYSRNNILNAKAQKRQFAAHKKAIVDLNAQRPKFAKNADRVPKQANEALWYYLPNMSEIFNND